MEAYLKLSKCPNYKKIKLFRVEIYKCPNMLLMTNSFVNLDFFSENIESSVLSIPSIFNTINFEI